MRILGIALCCSALLLAACDVTTPSQVRTGQIRVTERVKTTSLEARHVDTAVVRAAAEDWRQNGKGNVMLVAAYLSGNPMNEMAVKKVGAAYKQAFAENGVGAVQVDYVPVTDPAQTEYVILSYTATMALPPTECRRMTGYKGADSLQDVEGYKFGCETKSALSRMIANPDDLLGREGAAEDDARRQGGVVEKYKTGEPNDKLDGINASSVGTGG